MRAQSSNKHLCKRLAFTTRGRVRPPVHRGPTCRRQSCSGPGRSRASRRAFRQSAGPSGRREPSLYKSFEASGPRRKGMIIDTYTPCVSGQSQPPSPPQSPGCVATPRCAGECHPEAPAGSEGAGRDRGTCRSRHALMSARLLLALLEECNPDASNNRATHGR